MNFNDSGYYILMNWQLDPRLAYIESPAINLSLRGFSLSLISSVSIAQDVRLFFAL